MENKSIGRLISILYRQSQVYFNIAFRNLGISSSEYIFLIRLFEEDGLTQEELSERILIDKAATARSVKSLEEKGYVKRETDIRDKRAKKVHCTEKALHCKSQIYDVLKSWTKLLTEDMDAETLEIVIDSLEHMSGKVRSMNCKKLLQKE